MKQVLLILLAAAVTASAADLTGKWAGSAKLTGPDGSKDDSAILVLKHKGDEITGTIGPNAERQWEIRNAKLDGGKLTFEVPTDGPLVKFALNVEGDRITGEGKAEGGDHPMQIALNLKRGE